MIDFVKWCENKKLALPALDENTKRAGVSQEYPTGYIRNQYPDAYFAPIVATSYLDLKNAKAVSDRKDAGNTPL